MKIFIVAASLSLALLVQAEVMAKAPNIQVEVATLDDTTKCLMHEELFLSTSLDTINLAQVKHVPQVMVQVEYSAPPKRYDYRQARRVGRRYNKAVRYYRRLNRRDARDIRRDNKQKWRYGKRHPSLDSK